MSSNEANEYTLKLIAQKPVLQNNMAALFAIADAYDAGKAEAHKVMREIYDTLVNSPLVDPVTGQSSADKAYRILHKELYGTERGWLD